MKKQEPITSEPSSSSPSSLSYPYQLENLAASMLKSLEWLGELKELHYVPYNSPNALTIYSHCYWPAEGKLFVATKENNLKEISFRPCTAPIGGGCLVQEHSLESTETIYSNQSSESGGDKKTAAEPNQNNSTLTDETTSHLLTSSMIQKPEASVSYLEPSLKIHKFPRIKSEALISSIDLVDMDTFIIFVVSFVLKRKILSEQFFVHLYSDFGTSNFELLLECGQEYELDVMPHRVSHLRLLKSQDETNFIMANCSQRINVFYSIDAKSRRFEQVVKIEDFFVELGPESCVDNLTSHDIKHLDAGRSRLTALGFQNGSLLVFQVDADKNEVLRSFRHENDSFVTQVQFFTTRAYRDWSRLDSGKIAINLLVLRSLEPTRVINDVLRAQNLTAEEFQDLEISHFCDLVTSAVVYDATFSGYNSIVLGTFGKVACFFCPTLVDTCADQQQQQMGEEAESGSKTSSASSATAFTFKPGVGAKVFRYELKRELLFKHSILGLQACKLTQNGAYDLAVLTLNGVSVWQYDPESVVELINQKLEQHQKTIAERLAASGLTNGHEQ